MEHEFIPFFRPGKPPDPGVLGLQLGGEELSTSQHRLDWRGLGSCFSWLKAS